jgi:ABC-type transport system substrate-binding protein
MPRLCLILIAGLFLASCVPQPVPVPTSTPSPTDLPPAHAPEIRFALVGEPQDINVWQLFDASGASYADYALRSEYWPRLYHLVPPTLDFQTLAAEGLPSAVTQDGSLYSATVKLRADLKWTDGSSFTAEDVAFTVNTSLKYELGHDWASFYSADDLDHAEAPDPHTVKFYFKQKPNVRVWQYGALQGPIVQQAYWESKISEAAVLLPDEKLNADIEAARTSLARVQAQVNDITAQINQLFLNGKESRQLAGELVKRQGELGYANNMLDDLLSERAARIDSAHQVLYAIVDENEPTLGTWMPAGEEDGVWINEANPDFPFIHPHFDRAVYLIHADVTSAQTAFENGEVDVILSSSSLSRERSTVASPSNSERFLVINPNHIALRDPAVRQALACLINVNDLGLQAAGFASNDFWKSTDPSIPCDGLSAEQRIQKAVEFLKNAGYQWAGEPGPSVSGSGLKLPDGTEFPRTMLLSISAESDAERALAVNHIEQEALHLGIPLEVQWTDSSSLQYAVYSSKKYDIALVGWRVSEYPGYLCEWFGAGEPFSYASDRLQSACGALAVESDLQAARNQLLTIQSILSEDLPFIPLYTETTYDASQNVKYPFENVPGGLSGLYGAPSYAIPAR